MNLVSKSVLGVLGGWAWMTLPVLAEAPPDDGTETLVVTATRTAANPNNLPTTITVIDRESLDQQGAISDDLSQILGNLIPSFSPARQKMSGLGETFRGRSPLYLIDGIPQSTPLRDDSRDGHTIDMFMIERIEVVHGASAIQGMGATGGIINLITKKPSGEGLTQTAHAEVTAPTDYDSDGLGYKVGYMVSGREQGFDFLVGGSYGADGLSYDGHGDPIAVDATQGDLADTRNHNLFTKLGYEWGEQRLQFSIQDYELEGNGDYDTAPGSFVDREPATAVRRDVEGDPSKNDVTTYSLDYRHQRLAGGELTVQLFRQEYAGTFGGGRFATFQDPRFGPEVFDQSQNRSDKNGAKLTYALSDLFVPHFNLVTGVDYLEDTTEQALIQTGRVWVPPTEYKNWAPFLQAEYNVPGQYTLSAGLRHEESRLKVDDFTTLAFYKNTFVRGGEPDFDEDLANLGALYHLNEQWRVFASYSEGYGMPDVGRVLRGINKPNLSVDTFLDLQPIVTDNREVGIGYTGERFKADFSYYTSDADLGSNLVANVDGIFEVKREKTEIQGVEADIAYYLSDDHTLGALYARTEGESDTNGDGSVDTRLSGLNIPPKRVNLYWEAAWTEALATRLQVNKFYERRGITPANDFDGYTTADLSASWNTDIGDWRLGIENLTDKFYLTYYAQAGASNDADIFAGRGRTATLSWTYDF